MSSRRLMVTGECKRRTGLRNSKKKAAVGEKEEERETVAPPVDPCLRYLCSGKGFHSPDCPKVALFRENRYMARRPDDLITSAMRGFRAGERER